MHDATVRSGASSGPSASLTSLAYQALKAEILSNRLRPGEPLPTDRFMRELGLSRTPLREAIQRLEEEGFVEVRPRMGTFVSHFNLREIQEMYQVRQVLEGQAARLSVEWIAADELAPVEEALRRDPVEGVVDYAAMSEHGQMLHELIIGSCGNQVLTRIIQSLQDHFTRFRHLTRENPENQLASHREHLAILEAVKAGDGARAEAAMRTHFENAGRRLLESLLGRPAGHGAPPITLGRHR